MTVSNRWRKASASSNQTNCVELSHTLVVLRDSKNPMGPMLAVDARALVRAVQAGRVA